MKKLLSFCMAFLFVFAAAANQKITVLAAASLTNVLEEIKIAYLKTQPQAEIQLVFASSSTLAKQIEQGAPADIFISADQNWMDYLIKQNIVKEKKVLLNNTLVWIAPENAPEMPAPFNEKTLHSWIKPNTKIAVGDPSHVPAGIYAKDALTQLGLYESLKSHFVSASNVREALMYVELQEADFGIVYGTDAKITPKVKILFTFPDSSYPKIEYPITLLNQKALSFYDYLQSAPVSELFEQNGFSLP